MVSVQVIYVVYIYGLFFDGKELEESSFKIFWVGKVKNILFWFILKYQMEGKFFGEEKNL